MNYIDMYHKKTGEKVRVYNITVPTDGRSSFATIWSNQQHCWLTVKMNLLVPEDVYLETHKDDGCDSKTERNKIKSRLTLVSAIWETTDGSKFHSDKATGHKGLDAAIKHEKEIVDMEVKILSKGKY